MSYRKVRYVQNVNFLWCVLHVRTCVSLNIWWMNTPISSHFVQYNSNLTWHSRVVNSHEYTPYNSGIFIKDLKFLGFLACAHMYYNACHLGTLTCTQDTIVQLTYKHTPCFHHAITELHFMSILSSWRHEILGSLAAHQLWSLLFHIKKRSKKQLGWRLLCTLYQSNQ